MRTIGEILNDIKNNKQTIKDLDDKDTFLRIELAQVCDEFHRYEEKEETWDNGKKGKRRVETIHMVGRKYWNENFVDESNGDVITIERSQPVKIDGVWHI